MEQQRFRKHRQLRRAEFILTVMADDQVLDQRLQLRRKIWLGRKLLLQHLQLYDHVAQKLATCGVSKRTMVTKFVNLADVVQERAGQQQVTIDLRVISSDQIAGPKQRHDMIEQSANVSMMQCLRRGSVSVSRCNLRI